MDFQEFEQLVLRVLFESDVPVTAAHCAYLGRISVRAAERHLARMVEQETLELRVGPGGVAEYVYPGRRAVRRAPAAESPPIDSGATGGALMLARQTDASQPASSSAVTSVLLSALIPGAGHIYAGRSGAGVAWMCTTLLGYACCLLPGLFLHGLCMVSAANAQRTPATAASPRQ